MDAFYANVEIRDNPSLADKPMAIGSDHILVNQNGLDQTNSYSIVKFINHIFK